MIAIAQRRIGIMAGVYGYLMTTNMANRINRVLIILSVVPATAFASDPTPLFVLFVELPILVFSILFLVVCFFAPKTGLVLVSLLLLFSFVVLIWASGGYLDTAGRFLVTSMFVDIAGLVVAAKKISDARQHQTGEDS